MCYNTTTDLEVPSRIKIGVVSVYVISKVDEMRPKSKAAEYGNVTEVHSAPPH